MLPKGGYQFNVQTGSIPDSGWSLPAEKPYYKTKFDSCQDGRKSSGHASRSTTDCKKRVCHGGGHSQYATICYLVKIIFISCAGWYSLPFLDQWKSKTSNRLVLNMIKCHHVLLRCHSPLCFNFRQFNIKDALTQLSCYPEGG